MIQFFDLLREVRDLIYAQCVYSDGGYILDFDSNRLKCANGDSIDLTFMLTCKRVAREARGIALSTNILNFSSVCSEEHRITAGRFDTFLNLLHCRRDCKIDEIFPDVLSITEDIWKELSEIDPKFTPYLGLLKRRSNGWQITEDGRRERAPKAMPTIGPPGSCGETPSISREWVRSVLQTLLEHRHHFGEEQFTLFEIGWSEYRFMENQIASLVNVNPDPWEIPSPPQRVNDLIQSLGNPFEEYFSQEWDLIHSGPPDKSQIKYHYSAAAVAIRFLASLPLVCRMSIRTIILDEDRYAVGRAESHGLGLIPYCQENPRLRVERRASMWRTVLQSMTGNRPPPHTVPEKRQGNECLYAASISDCVAVWVLEALELERAGMPAGSFSLVLDGDSVCPRIFQDVVQRDAACQAAVDLCLERKILPALSWSERRSDPRHNWRSTALGEYAGKDNMWYLFEDFPQAIRDITSGNSIVKCNFDVGKMVDPEALVRERRYWKMDDWKEGWWGHKFESFRPDSGSWIDLLCDNSYQSDLPFDYNDYF
ncbi:hypothetical protein CGCA056_v001755 [Colletotrichum aenigma]|uniref:uncharacterized protein n=1 Tax=Colletotrichum aenigma TaxID=1215731 RepID=UPI001872222B|nr:uncharacterized protein CGCA056_v001755 [Colletotrichum aenigma]KAF5527506.1 hypothetical protein CGCA056_v001755 [Colletotrichum aenigma]